VGKVKKDSYDSVFAQVSELKTARPELKEILDFWLAVFKAQRQVKMSFQPDLSGIDKDICRKRNLEGLPFLKPEDIKIDQALFNSLFEDICQIIRKQKKEILPAALKGFSSDNKCAFLLRGIMEDGTSLEKLASELKIDSGLFYFLAIQVLSPFLESYACKLKDDIDLSSWTKGTCPVCGKEPVIAKLEKGTGSRWLFCSFCHSEWLFKRLLCPFCENDDQESLRYFYVENEEAYRVDVCDKCKRYTKTVDTRKIDREINLFVEDLATLSLDIIAEKEGFCGIGTFFLRK
jgi:FdhE protein